MKPANFPARKLARQVAAQTRSLGYHDTARLTLQFPREGLGPAIEHARGIRTKKRRSP